MTSESVDSQKILHHVKKRIKLLHKKNGTPILELSDSLAREAGFLHWHDFSKNLAKNSEDSKVKKMVELVNERSEYDKEKQKRTDENTAKWMRRKAEQAIHTLGFQWKLMSDRDQFREHPVPNPTLLLADKNQLSLPENENEDFNMAMRLATYYQANKKHLAKVMEDLLYREITKVFLQNKEHFLREFPQDQYVVSSQHNLNWLITEVYRALHSAESRNENEDLLYHLLRSSPQNEDTASAPSRYPIWA